MRMLILGFVGLFALAGCSVPPGQIRKHTTPGHIQQQTGYNPASGKMHPKKGAKAKTSEPDVDVNVNIKVK